MHNKPTLLLEIPDPCLENWAGMTPCAQGRFCMHCQKEVIDFTNWSDTALFRFFEQQEGPVCGRMHAAQLNRPISLPPQKRTLLYQAVMAFGLVLMTTGAATETNARPRPPLVQYNLPDTIRAAHNDSAAIVFKGVVLDEEGKPFEGVRVLVKEKGILKGGAMTDEDGKYAVSINSADDIALFDLEFSCLEYVRRVINGADKNKWQSLAMERSRRFELTGLIIRTRRPFDKTETYDPKRFGY